MNYTGQKNTGMSTSSFAIGLLVGAAAGAGLALLFAPKAGSELRGQIGESMSSWKDAAGKKIRNVADRAGAGLSDLQSSMGKTSATTPETPFDASRSRL